MIKQDLQHWFNNLSLDDRLKVQKFVLDMADNVTQNNTNVKGE